jgi:hypothetical protein
MKILLLFLSLFMALPIVSKTDESRPQVLFETSLGKISVVLYNETPLHRDNYLNPTLTF